LHVSIDDDRGGNLVTITGPCKSNLHAVWDNCIIEKKIGVEYPNIAAKLRAEITDEDRAQWAPAIIDIAAVVSWANESSAIAEDRMCNIASRRKTPAGLKGLLRSMTLIWLRKPLLSGTGSRELV
jgi:hypothetical protein